MKVVLLQDVSNLGMEGEVKEVADGYGRNFLLPRKLAALATPSVLKLTEAQRRSVVLRRQRSGEELKELGDKLEGLSIQLKVKVGAKERLYGSITSADIAGEINRITGLDIEKKRIKLEKPIQQLGDYRVPIKLGGNVMPRVNVTVEGEES
jgi:large subunit ribosomal protein L9